MTDWYRLVKKLKGVPTAEEIAVSYWESLKPKYVITFSKIKQMFYLYEVNKENKVVKTKEKSKSPADLEKKLNLKVNL